MTPARALFVFLLTLVLTTTIALADTSACATTLATVSTSCTGGKITQDALLQNGCRITVCQAPGSVLQTLACPKPGSDNQQYFEVYKQTRSEEHTSELQS